MTETEPVAMALNWAVNVAPAEWLDSKDTTLLSEISGGPGHVPPDAALPPCSTMSEPTVTQTGVT